MTLFLKAVLATLILLILYRSFILHPQIREIKRKMALPEFQGSAHAKTMEFHLGILLTRSRQLAATILVLCFITLAIGIYRFR